MSKIPRTYPIADDSRRALYRVPGLKDVPGLTRGRAVQYQLDEPGHRLEVRAVSTGETRAPRAGEWYLSGAIVEAYHAPNDLSTAYTIARLVVVRIKQVQAITLEIEL